MKIAIVKLSAIGDIVQSMIVLEFIKKTYPSADIDWFVDNKFKSLLEFNPNIRRIYPIDMQSIKKKKSIVKLIKNLLELRKLEKYDYILDIQGLLKSAVITRFIRAKNKFGFSKKGLRERLAYYFYSNHVDISYDTNVIERYVGFINQVFNQNFTKIDIIKKKPFLFFSNLPKGTLSKGIKKYAVIVPGASFPSKIYPYEKFIKIVNELDYECLIIWGNIEEQELAKKISKQSKNALVADKLSINDLKFVIANSSIVIGGDTGPTHMAWGLNIPSITIFGSTPLGRNFYITDINLGIQSVDKVNPYKISKTNKSINKIHPKEILKLIRTLKI